MTSKIARTTMNTLSTKHVTPKYPRIPLKDMDGTMLVFELGREIDRVIADPDHREMVSSAASVASFLHRNQTRKVRKHLPEVPYIEHPLRVTLRLIRKGSTDPHTLAAALLHDVVEDCAAEIVSVFAGGDASKKHRDPEHDREVALYWLRESYGQIVAETVEEVSNPLDDDVAWIDHMETIESLRSLMIKASDLVDNPGSLIHQYGHVKDSFVLYKVIKYSPGVPLIAGKLGTHIAQPGVSAMIEALNGVSANLKILEGYLAATGAQL